MPDFETKCGVKVIVTGKDSFMLDAVGRDNFFSREQLTEFRSVIDQALNTSQEEIDAQGD